MAILRMAMFTEFHDEPLAGHLDIRKTFSLINDSYYLIQFIVTFPVRYVGLYSFGLKSIG